jgi:putative ABC transport system permease protein
MWRVALRGLAAHKLRLTLTALAIVLGVGFVAGTFVLTDTINRTFTDLFQQTSKGIDVAVRTKAAFTSSSNEQRAPMPAALLGQIKAVPGVAAAEGGVTGYAQFVGADGKPVTTGGAPTLGVSLNTIPRLQSATLREGRWPAGPGEVVVDARTAKKQGFHVGDRVKILFQGAPGEFAVSGIIGFGSVDSLAGATLAGFDPGTAARVLNREGVFDEVDVVAADGVSDSELRQRVQAAVGPGFEVLTGGQLAEENSKLVGQFVKFINYALLAFAFVALLVGSFIIVNTFSIILAQRARELALLRCVGASRRQVLGVVLGEASVVGLVASVVGLGAGVLIAIGLKAVFVVIGADMPMTRLVIGARTVLVALAVGLLVTLLAALLPAVRASRVPPVTALQEQAGYAVPRLRRWRVVTGAVLALIGVAVLLLGVFAKAGNRLLNVAGGAVLIFLGVGLLTALVARPLARLLGWPFAHWTGQAGKLARDNAMRAPRRTASTASALMIGLALISFASIFAASLKSSVSQILDEAVVADYILTGPANSAQGFSPQVAARLAQQPEIASATGVRIGLFKVDGVPSQLFGVDPVAYSRTVLTEATAGNLADLAAGGVAARDDVAKAHGWRVGDQITMEFPIGGAHAEPLRAVYKDNQLNGPYLLALPDYQRYYPDQMDVIALVKIRPGVSAEASRVAVDRVVADFPTVQIKDQAEYKEEQAKQIDQILVLFYLLVALAVVIAFIGIVNTLALSVLERVRELGLLRALGMTRGQMRSMIRWEAVIIAVLGAALGLVLGVFFGWTMVRALRDQGVTEFSVPVATLVVFVVVAALAGVLAAVFPGRRAARIDMLRAITTE